MMLITGYTQLTGKDCAASLAIEGNPNIHKASISIPIRKTVAFKKSVVPRSITCTLICTSLRYF
ncbi:hypothetical protein D3C73_397030 [compost metagenome]